MRFRSILRSGAAGGESHERGVEVDVGGGARCASGVAVELVLVAGPRAVGDPTSDAGAEDDDQRATPYGLPGAA
jgi:hypothetical protein